MLVVMIQFQYFWDFDKCCRAIISQLRLEHFCLYLLCEVVIDSELSKIIISNLLLKSLN